MERDWVVSAGKQFYLPGRFQGPVQSNRRIRPRRRAVPPCRARPCVTPCPQLRDIGLQDMLRADKTRDKVANLEPGGVGVCQNDKPLRCSNALEQPLQRAVLEHPEAVRRQDRAVHDIAKRARRICPPPAGLVPISAFMPSRPAPAHTAPSALKGRRPACCFSGRCPVFAGCAGSPPAGHA